MADDFDTLIKDLAFAEAAPDEALRKAVPHARALAPKIAALAKRRIEGAWLYPAEDNLLFYGLFVLAAARTRPFWPIWLELLKLPEAGSLFGDGPVVSVASVTLGFFEKDAASIAQLIERPEASPDVRAGLLFALTRLTCEGAYARTEFVALIDRLADGPIGERGKRDLEEAIILGGVEERAELLKQFWRADAVEGREKAHARAELRAAAAEPSALARFDKRGIAAPVDPSDPLAWFMPLESEQNPAREDAALSWRECDKLEAVLKRGAGGAEAMRFEQLDGLAHALVLGPELVLPSECTVAIWGEEGPQFDGPLEARICPRLLERHWNAIALRAEEEGLASPWLEAQRNHAPGQLWGRGFASGVRMRGKAWEAMPADHAAARTLADVLSLERGDVEAGKRIEILRGLGDLVAQIAGYWRLRRRERG
jgi:yecA family protein